MPRLAALTALALALLAPVAHAAGYRSLSSEGWRHAGGARVEIGRDGVLRTKPGDGLGVLWYARERFRDFQLRLRFRAARGANSGVHVRFPKPGGSCSWIDCGHEVQINDTASDPRRTGSIYGFADLDDAGARTKPPGTWSTLTIRVVGQAYTVYRDGVRINRYVAGRGRSGYIGLQAHGGAQDAVAFRDIRIREL